MSIQYSIKKSGFTLVELVLVVVIMGILSSIAFPAFQNHIRQAQEAQVLDALANFRTAVMFQRAQSLIVAGDPDNLPPAVNPNWFATGTIPRNTLVAELDVAGPTICNPGVLGPGDPVSINVLRQLGTGTGGLGACGNQRYSWVYVASDADIYPTFPDDNIDAAMWQQLLGISAN